MDDTETSPPAKMLEDINALTGMQLELNGNQLRRLGEEPEEMRDDIPYPGLRKFEGWSMPRASFQP